MLISASCVVWVEGVERVGKRTPLYSSAASDVYKRQTLLLNGLNPVETVMKSQAVLINAPDLSDEKQTIINRLLFRIKSVLKAKNYKYILLNAPNDRLDKIVSLIPGMKSPTVLPLADGQWSSVHSVIEEEKFWSVIESLQDLGAEGILIAPIEKMVL